MLHLNKRRAYLQAAWKPKWIKPGLRRAEKLWTTKYVKLRGIALSPPLSSADVVSDAERTMVDWPCYERWRQSQHAKMHSRNVQSEFQRFINSPIDSIAFTAGYTVPDWWLEPCQQRTYPRLYRMAVDILSAASMSTESERVFSRARPNVIFDRERLKTESV